MLNHPLVFPMFAYRTFFTGINALATNIGDTFLYEKGKESRGGTGKARDARAA